MVTQMMYGQISNATKIFAPELKKHFGFCMTNVDAEWNRAFNFSSDLGFLENCMAKQKDLAKRVCTAAEVKFYFSNVFQKGNRAAKYLKPNKNCNLTSWVNGCEPGWACSAGNQKVNMKDEKNVPTRTEDCHSCCDGFFCPHGLTCMMPCPLGAYCPHSELDKSSDIDTNFLLGQKTIYTCGGADIWTTSTSSPGLFCTDGIYYPSTIKRKGCTEGWTGITSGCLCIREHFNSLRHIVVSGMNKVNEYFSHGTCTTSFTG